MKELLRYLKMFWKGPCISHLWRPDGIVPVNWDLLDYFHCPVICSRCGKRGHIPNYMFKEWPEAMIDKTKKL
jgi:hypothetical protein